MENNLPKIKISVILPVYNVEPYIGRCIESLKTQEFTMANDNSLQRGELEFIFIDDCGTDGSMKHVESFAAEDNRVHVIRNKKNMGTGPSRNAGIEVARGEYFSFIDPDDYISSDFYALLWAKAAETGATIIKGSRIKVSSSDDNRAKPVPCEKSSMNASIRKALKKGVPLYCVFAAEHQSAIYSRSLFLERNVRYGTSAKGQDTTFQLEACFVVQGEAICYNALLLEDRAVYYYVQRPGSATAEYTPKRAFAEIDSLREKLDFLLLFTWDNHKTMYLKKKLRDYFTCYCDASEQNSSNAISKENYSAMLKCQISRIPDIPALLKHFGEIRAFLDYEAFIPAVNRRPDRFHKKRIDGWTTLLIKHPDADKTYSYEYAYAALYTLASYTKNRWRTTGQIDSSGRDVQQDALEITPIKYIRQQIEKLEPARRKSIYKSLPSAIAAIIRQRFLRLRHGFYE